MLPSLAKLEPRLLAVATEISCDCHADVGSDHALLPKYLLDEARADHVIAVEKNKTPFLNSQKTLLPYVAQGRAEVRLGDGLCVLKEHEVDSLSVSGLGAERILKILKSFPDRLPSSLVLQANDKPERLRAWALGSGFKLINEQMTRGFWHYTVLSFQRSTLPDKAYQKLPKDLALYFGPLLLEQQHPLLLKELRKNQAYLKSYLSKNLSPPLEARLELIEKALTYYA